MQRLHHGIDSKRFSCMIKDAAAYLGPCGANLIGSRT